MCEHCIICGAPISSLESVPRGYGPECAEALNMAIWKMIKDDPKLMNEYCNIDSKLIVEEFKKIKLTRLRSEFKKKFIPSVIAQFEEKGYLSKKQKDVAFSVLSTDALDRVVGATDAQKKEFKDNIRKNVNGEMIERARNVLRQIKDGKTFDEIMKS